MKKTDLSSYRKSYSLKTLDISDVSVNPMEQFSKWFADAEKSSTSEANATVLSTSDNAGRVSSRMVLLKEFSPQGFVFFTNYQSLKGKQLQENPYAALLFFWPELQRQVRIEGTVKKITAKQSDEYFNSRPESSKIAAIISTQSTAVPNREYLDTLFQNIQNSTHQKDLKRPKHWGGYILQAQRMEFWQGRNDRLHDRIVYIRSGKSWKITRLAP